MWSASASIHPQPRSCRLLLGRAPSGAGARAGLEGSRGRARARARLEGSRGRTRASGTGGSTQIFVQRDLGEIQNFVDATEAGRINSHLCTLILIEGRSASSFVTTGLTGILKRKWYGSYSFIGNFINPRTASVKEVQNNKEAQELVTILGLQSEKHYENVSELRYGKIIIMTDQDVDGMHIKGLVINFFHTYWPSLLGVNSFMSQLVTPLIKVAIPCSKGVIQFESVQSYETWRRNVGRRILGTWRSTYYKGLGNHGYEGSRFYLQNLNNHTRAFLPLSKDDGEWIEMVFSPKKVEERKNWILKQEVTSLSSKVSALTSYHHGANCVEKTITLMCQNFVGKRNINLLAPMGMFGTRYKGGKDHASPRYTFTKLGTLTRKIFVPADDRLSYTDECDRTIEPKWLLPIIPMVLVNGTTGVGSGWNSNVPQYNPTCIIRNLKHLLHEQKPVPMEPSYRGFKGSLKKISTGYELHGKIEIVDDHTLRITELPIGYSTEKFKSELFEHMSQKQPCVEKSAGKNGITVEEVQDNCTGDEIDFLVTLTKENMTLAKQMGLVAAFNLRTKVNTNNMHLYNGKGIITKFETAEQILEEFVKLRLPFYVTRKEQELQSIERMITEDRNRLKYISALLNDEFDAISLNGEELSKRGFDPCVRDKDPSTYEYLIIGMARNVNIGARKMLEQQIDRLKETCESLRKISAKEIWLRDLTILEHEIALQDKKLKSREDCCAGDIIGSSASSSPESERRPMKSKLKPNTEVDVECTIPGDALIQVSPRPVTRSQSACNSPTCSLVAPLTFPRRRRRRQLSPAIPLGGLIPLPVSQASPGPITRRHDLNQEITELPQDIATMESMQETQMGGNCRQEGGLATAQDTKVLDSVRAVLTSWPRRLNWHTVLKVTCTLILHAFTQPPNVKGSHSLNGDMRVYTACFA